MNKRPAICHQSLHFTISHISCDNDIGRASRSRLSSLELATRDNPLDIGIPLGRSRHPGKILVRAPIAKGKEVGSLLNLRESGKHRPIFIDAIYMLPTIS